MSKMQKAVCAVGILILISFFSCSEKKDNCFYLFNNEQICKTRIIDFKDKFDIKLIPNYGFVGVYNDTLLNSFLLRFDGEQIFFYEHLNQSILTQLEDRFVTSIQFKKITDVKQFSLEDISRYVLRKYSNAKLIKENDTLFFIERDNHKIAKVEYNSTGIVGCFVTLLPQPTARSSTLEY